MEKSEQIELAKKIELLVEKRMGSHYGFSHNGTDKTVTLKITSSEMKYINWANDFLKPFKLPRLRTMKNHGSGMKTTILINVSKISKESIEKIDMDHKKLIKEMGTRKNHQSFKPKPIERIEDNKEMSTPVVEKQKRSRKACPHYNYSKFLSNVLAFEGFDFKKEAFVRKDGGFLKVCSENTDVLKLVEQATNYYVGGKVACVFAGNDKNDTCVSFEHKGDNTLRTKYKYCSAPNFNSEDMEAEVLKRLNRVHTSRKYVVAQISVSRVKVVYNSINREDLIISLLEMGWKVTDESNGFLVLSSESKDTKKEDEVEFSENSEVDNYVEKYDIYEELCKLADSPDFSLLDDELQKEVLLKRDAFIRKKKVAEVSIYAKSLLDKLK